MVNYYPCVFHALYVGHPTLLPYFARRDVLDYPEKYKKYPKLLSFAKLPFEAFVEQLKEGEIYFLSDEDLAPQLVAESLREDDAMETMVEFDGAFSLINELIPASWRNELRAAKEGYQPLVQYLFNWGDEQPYILHISLQRSPELFKAAYASPNDILQEVQTLLKELRVDIPEDFPLWKCIGVFTGVQYEDS